MPRIRTIKPEFWESESNARVSIFARHLFVGLISQADDDGRGHCGGRFLASRLFPYDGSNVTRRIPAALQELAREGQVVLYSGPDGTAYYCIPRFRVHQKIESPRPSSLPPPPGFAEESPIHREPSPTVRRGVASVSGMGKGMEREGEGEAAPPKPSALAGIPPPSIGSDGTVMQMLRAAARCANIPNNPETVDRYLKSWKAKKGAQETERILMLPEVQGWNVIQIDGGYFGGGKAKETEAEQDARIQAAIDASKAAQAERERYERMGRSQPTGSSSELLASVVSRIKVQREGEDNEHERV